MKSAARTSMLAAVAACLFAAPLPARPAPTVPGPSASTIDRASAAVRVARGDESTAVPFVNVEGRRFIPLGGALLAAVGDGVTVRMEWPFAVLSRAGLDVRIAAGLSSASGPEAAAWWLPEAPRAVAGEAALTPESLAIALKRLGVACRWDPAGDTLELAGPSPVPQGEESPEAGKLEPEAAAPEEPANPGDGGTAPQASPPPAASSLGRWPLHIVLDAGHGGRDCGARGETGMCEKDVTLDLVLRIAKKLRARGARITLTRGDDTYVSLPKRVRVAARAKADLFVSIHVNASPSDEASGVETYVYGARTTSRRAAAVARRENAEANYMDLILGDLAQQVHHEASIRVAGSVEKELVRRLSVTGRAHERVMEAPFYVLARSGRPAVLFEVGFISNPAEEARLRQSGYRKRLADVIASGLAGLANRPS